MRILGIDYGDSRVGISITDPLCIIAQGLETIQYNGNDKILLRKLEDIIEKYNVDKIVVGMPINLKGEETKRTEITHEFIHKLKCKFPKVDILTMDERLTTVEAHRTMNDLNINKKKKRNIVDTISAVYILEKYINSNK